MNSQEASSRYFQPRYHLRATSCGTFHYCPINWRINMPVKRGFFELVREITGGSKPKVG